MISRAQIKAARGLLGLAAGTVARMASLSKTTYQAAEAGELQLDAVRLGRIRTTLERAGIEFASDGCGASLRPKEVSTITPAQVRAARKLLGWSYATLAQKAGCRLRLVGRVEQMDGQPPEDLLRTVFALQHALETAGVEFTDGQPGVRLKKDDGRS